MPLFCVFLCNEIPNKASNAVILIQFTNIIIVKASTCQSVGYDFFEDCDYALSFLLPVTLKVSLSTTKYVNLAHDPTSQT